ncbi:MAG: hypothetical protein PHH17_00470 [Candidatus Pacebacteria bacterium]|jgi:hypothetical protein|nr:hypothetical protein [Candidatus Paceibacterota bacterium]MDD3072173.1 hypothetical protein [Candidatus Paceibacterota bacterium]MDD3728762.1 hypothetical protein [Candidatus Paceibacterota bacterium]MDD4201379.1 hypothetical protein [Candidatus Paceibacterota bacterium]MDD4467201.1 hypothetical protein [Candidatus Paceibacterota bacterium]
MNNTIKNNIFPITVIAVSLVISGIVLFSGPSQGRGFISQDEALKIADDFINKKMLQGQVSASVSDISEESGLYKINLSVQGSPFSSYMTKDGRFFFPEGLDIENFENTTPPSAPSEGGGGTGMVGGC